MKALVTLLLIGLVASAEPEASDEPPGTSEAAAVLSRALASMPDAPLAVEGTLKTRRPRGFVHGEMRFTMELDFSRYPFKAVYRIFTARGEPLYTLNLTRDSEAHLHFEIAGDDAAPVSTPPLSDAIGESDLTWLDLTLDVLWWKAVRIEGQERMRGRDCDIVLARPPRPVKGYGGARLWVDREIGMLLQAEHLDEHGKPFRKMWIRSVKKIGDRWFVKDLEVDSVHSGTRTRLRVEDVSIEP